MQLYMKIILVPGTYYWNYDYVGLAERHKDDFEVIIDEHPELFVSYKYHKSAIIYRRLCAIKLAEHLRDLKIDVKHIKFGDHEIGINKLHGSNDTFFFDPSNDRIYGEFINHGFKMLPGMSFYFQPEFFDTKHFWTDRALYSYVCKETGFKFAGKSYDTLNRNKLPKDTEYSDRFPVAKPDSETFPDIERLKLWGSGNIYFSTTRKDALRTLDRFLSDDIRNFGPYQDAMDFTEGRGNIVYHSGISSMLNIGLIVPADVLSRVLAMKTKGIEQSVEAFFRQIFGWREYMRQIWLKGVYISVSRTKSNKTKSENTKKYICSWPEFMTGHYSKYYLLHNRGKISLRESDNTIVSCIMKRIEETGYCHHIERLMILGNYLLMSGCDPVNAIEQFLGLTVDAYPWVMYGNVVYMSQFTFGRVYTSRPYFSSGNYIQKMSIGLDGHKEALEDFDRLYHKFMKAAGNKLPKMWH